MPNRQPRTYTNRSAGLPVDNLPALGLALVKGIKKANLKDDEASLRISRVLLRESPVLTGKLIDLMVLTQS